MSDTVRILLLPSEFELTPYLKDGENKLAVQVFKWTIGSWCEDQDFFRFSGIFRSVYLYMIPKTHLCDIKIRPQVAENLSCGTPGAGPSLLRPRKCAHTACGARKT